MRLATVASEMERCFASRLLGMRPSERKCSISARSMSSRLAGTPLERPPTEPPFMEADSDPNVQRHFRHFPFFVPPGTVLR